MCRPAIFSLSLGRAAQHDLQAKLREASRAGFNGVEIFYEDLSCLASTYQPKATDTPESTPSNDQLLQAAHDVHRWCLDLDLEIISLQPFMFYEGLTDRAEHEKKISLLKFWLELCTVLHTDLILIPSTFQADGTTGDLDVIVADMTEVADLGAQHSPPIRFAYENLSWGRYINTWEQVWDVVQRVDRANFGLCIDTFNICGSIWADPAAPSGRVPDADHILAQSIDRLLKTVDPRKIFFAQIVDGERLSAPLVPGHEWYQEDQPARMSWSRNARLFAYEGGYLPIEAVMDALFDGLKWRGWISTELFSRTLSNPDPSTPSSHAQRAMNSWLKMKERYGFGASEESKLSISRRDSRHET